jgi:hypothetical protein
MRLERCRGKELLGYRKAHSAHEASMPAPSGRTFFWASQSRVFPATTLIIAEKKKTSKGHASMLQMLHKKYISSWSLLIPLSK